MRIGKGKSTHEARILHHKIRNKYIEDFRQRNQDCAWEVAINETHISKSYIGLVVGSHTNEQRQNINGMGKVRKDRIIDGHEKVLLKQGVHHEKGYKACGTRTE